MNGFAEINIFMSTIVRNSIRMLDYQYWLWRLPDLPGLHTESLNTGLDRIVFITGGSLIKYKDGDDADRQELEPVIQLSSQLNVGHVHKGSIIIEIAYPADLEYVRKKAAAYLWSDKPRPSVVVIFIFKSEDEDKEYRDIIVKFEVRRQNEDVNGETKVYEEGVSACQIKTRAYTNNCVVRLPT